MCVLNIKSFLFFFSHALHRIGHASAIDQPINFAPVELHPVVIKHYVLPLVSSRLFNLPLVLAFMQGSKRQPSRAAVSPCQASLLTTLVTSSQLRPGAVQVKQKLPQFTAPPRAQVACLCNLPACLPTSPSSNNSSSRPCQHSWSPAVGKISSRLQLLVLPLGMQGHWGLQGRSRPPNRRWHLGARVSLRYSEPSAHLTCSVSKVEAGAAV